MPISERNRRLFYIKMQVMQRHIFLGFDLKFNDFLSLLLCLSCIGHGIIIARHKLVAQSISEGIVIAESICQAAAWLHWRLL